MSSPNKKEAVKPAQHQQQTKAKSFVAKGEASASPNKKDKARATGGKAMQMRDADLARPKALARQASVHSAGSLGYQSSDAPEAVVKLSLGYKTAKDTTSFCTGYAQHRGLKVPRAHRHLFSDKVYRKQEGTFSWSQRLFLSRECASSEDRRMLPVLIV
mgnify:CR=1 FL=1